MDSDSKQLLKGEGSKFCRGSVDVRCDSPMNVLDAGTYAKEACDKVTDKTIKNSFIKADLRISLNSAITETFDNKEFLKLFKNFNITATDHNNNELKSIDDESSNLFQEEILEEANRIFLKNSKQ